MSATRPGKTSQDKAFASAAAHYQQGRLDEAESGLRDIQKAEPDLPDVLHLLALIALQTERPADAIKYLEKAVAAVPDKADFFNLLGGALKRENRPADAADAFEKAVAIDPGLTEAHYNLGNALKELERFDEAIPSYRRAVALKPDFADAYYNLALALKAAGRFADAAEANREVLALSPDDGEAWNNLGNVLEKLDRPGEAVQAYEKAIPLQPDRAETYNNLGNALRELRKPEEAVANFNKALALKPDFAEAMGNLGAVYREQGKLDEAMETLEAAIALKPDYAAAHCNRGNVLGDRGDFDAAHEAFDKAIALEPDHVRAHVSKSALFLLKGDFERGWKESEWRWRIEGGDPKRDFPQPPWTGTGPEDKTILVWAEQGVGDEILFAGMVPDLIDAGAKVVLECEERLMPLFERSFTGVDCLAWRQEPAPEALAGNIDFQIPSGGLARWLRPDLDAFPGRPSYLLADAGRRDALRAQYLEEVGDFLVGIAWLSSNKEVGWQKSMSLMDLRPLTEVPGVRFVDLQYGDTVDERRAFEKETGVPIIHDDGVDQMKDLDAFAAQVAAMDLVISVSNTTVHMAGALGQRTWVLLHQVPLNVWMLDRDDSPWYPSVRLFRQSGLGEWADVVERVGDELAALAAP